MVCKEEVFLWFKDLESYKRIDVLYGLLNMCVPYELRFLGSCVEEMGKHAYEELRGPEISANALDRLSKDGTLLQGLLDRSVRRRVIVYMSLLSSRNYSVASWLYRSVLRTDWLEEAQVKGSLKDENVQSEFLVLFVMALHHPAFTFEQKSFFKGVLAHLYELKGDTQKRISPRPSGYGYPPGFGYPTIKTMNTQEIPLIPLKTSITIPCDDALHQQPPCLPPSLQPSQEFVAWSIPGFPCGAPEVPAPFPMPPAVSPLVSESTSPDHSRTASPHRIVTLRSTPMPPPPPPPPRPIDATVPTHLPLDPLSTNNFPFLHPPENVKVAEDDLNSIPMPGEKIVEGGWISCPTKETKQPNGIRIGPCQPKHSPRALVEQFQALSANDDCPLPYHHHHHHHAAAQRSHSSSGSSPNRTPPETPHAAPPPSSQHAAKPRVNGMPSFSAPPPPGGGGGLPMCDATSPPPPPTFNSCSVPYTATYPPFTAIATRSMFPYTQSYRPPFTHYASYHQSGESSFPTYSLPLVPIIYSSQFPPRTPNCFNCGGMGHSGQECTGPSIDDITKNTYTVEFAAAAPPPTPDADK